MHTESSIADRDHKEKRNSLAEVSNVERQLWISVQYRGLLSANVRNLYRKACGLYEKIFLGNTELEELQETEYSLWKLHYKQIDEFRKQASQSHGNDSIGPFKNHGSIQEGFRLFLEESSRFYQDLISAFKRYYGFQGLTLLYHKHTDSVSSSAEHAKLHTCRLVCHRLLVRLGDLARYLEVNHSPGIRKRKWSAAAQCYFEAAKMYPDGGNPQNQLALLATPAYIGNEFLALYHCVRSIAVKEPFPDASDNLIFIFERNMSSVQTQSLSVGLQFDFLKPSERIMTSVQAQVGNGASDFRATEVLDADFWSLFVSLTSLFFLQSSLGSFSCTFASTIRELEALLEIDDAKLSIALESYQNVNISRPGPYRALQLISVLIFTVHNLSEIPQFQCLKKLQMALTITFICMGRIVERCLKTISIDDFPLLPTVMVFSEWLVEALEKVEKCEIDENLTSAISYFFTSYVKLLNKLLEQKNQVESPNRVALWEDFEMRGFIPVSQCHSYLDFSTYWENEAIFRAGGKYRIHRIIEASIKIANKHSDGNQSWIFYEKGGKFYTKEAKENDTCLQSKAIVAEEEEDIVFKPFGRSNSTPFSACLIQKELKPEHPAFDESLRRASSLLIAQNRALINSLTPHSVLNTIPEAPPSSGGRLGPPSLSSWVLNDNKTASKRLSKISFSNNAGDRFCFVGSRGESSDNYCAPMPSAPPIPEDATWPPTHLHCTNSYNKGLLQLHHNDPSSQLNRLYVDQRYPFLPIPAVYTESTVSMRPASSFVSGLCDQRKLMDVGENQEQLVQYLKEKEWRTQQEAQIAHYANTRN